MKGDMESMIKQREEEAYKLKTEKANQVYDRYTAKKHEIRNEIKREIRAVPLN